MTKDEKIAKLGKVITDRATVLLGKDKITPDSPEYLGINSALKFTAVKYDEKMADDILDIALTMKKRVPLTIEQLAKKNPQFDRAYLEKAMQAISESGLVEFHWENLDGKNPNHEKRWVLPLFVPGSAEFLNMRKSQIDEHPEVAAFFERMTMLPLEKITPMVPPGGAGIGMHVIPVEKAIETENESVDLEHISYWLSKPAEHPAYEGAVELVSDISGQYAFRQIEGTLPDGRRALVIWRSVTDDIVASNAALDAYFTTYRKNAQDRKYDVIFVNGDSNLENLRRSNEGWTVQMTEIEFKKRMFEEA